MLNDADMLLKLVSTSLFAGAVAVFATIAIERLGGKLGGILATIPTTIVPASFGFWYLSSEIQEFEDALWAVPVGMLLNAAFLHSWHWLPERFAFARPLLKLLLVICGSLSLWFLLALLGVQLMSASREFMPWVGATTFLIQLVYGFMASRNDRAVTQVPKKVGSMALLARGTMAAFAIAAAAIIIAMGHPILAGVASVFPAIFLTIMVSVWVSQGEHFPATAVGSMMLGSTSVSGYALVSIWSFAKFGPIWGSAISWCLSLLLISIPSARLLKSRRRGRS